MVQTSNYCWPKLLEALQPLKKNTKQDLVWTWVCQVTDVVVGEPPAVCEITLPEVLASALCSLCTVRVLPQPKNTCHQLDSGTIRLGDGTACSEGRLNINKILAPCEVPLRLPFPQAGKQLLNSWSSFKVKLIDDEFFLRLSISSSFELMENVNLSKLHFVLTLNIFCFLSHTYVGSLCFPSEFSTLNKTSNSCSTYVFDILVMLLPLWLWLNYYTQKMRGHR